MKVTAINPVRHNGKLYQPGEALEVDDTTADSLLACDAVKVMKEAEAEKKTEPEGDETEQAANSVEPAPAKTSPEPKTKGKK